MDSSGSGFLELSILDLKLDKTIMEKQISIDVEIDNQAIASIPVSRTGKKMQVEINSSNEIMELKICAGTSARSNHIGKYKHLSI
jgi:hypothetical protein